MSRRDALALLPLAESIADGTPIDWAAAEAGANGRDLALIRQLRVLSDLAGLHRSLPAADDETPVPGSTRRTLAAPAIGSWAHLALIERLGGGTFGDVYRAWDRHLEREVALKLLRADEAFDDLHASRIAREGRLLARVRHANVIAVHGVDAHDGRVGLWMELVRGVTLEQQIAAHGALSAREAAAVGIDLCRALAAIHAAGLIHRDVKAQNVMREDGGRIVLMDLGTGREVDAAGDAASPDLAGTPLYLAPEIFSGAPASERTDLYSLGVLLYRLVTGAFPVRATTIKELQAAHKHGRNVRLRDARADLPTGFVRVIDRAIAADPGQRYATAGAFEADLVQALGDSASATIVVHERERHEATWRMPRRRTAAMIAALAAAAIAVAAIGWPTWSNRWSPAVASRQIRSIAVLPFVNLTGDPGNEYLADGLTDELIGALGEMGGVNVISRTSAMRFKGAATTAPEIARKLRVDAILESSMRLVPGESGGGAVGGRVRINARLIYAGTDTQLWDRTFEAVASDLIGLQVRMAKAVAEALPLRVAPIQKAATARTVSEDSEAQDAYLQGRYLLQNSPSRANLAKARTYLERAVKIDPTYARAFAALARCYTFLDVYGMLSHRDAASLVASAATTAVRIDASLPEAQNEFAEFSLLYRWDWPAAERAYRDATTLNPSYSFARSEYARFLAADNRLDEAMQQARLALEADPLSAEAAGVVSLTLYYQRKYDEAASQRLKAIELNPDSATHHLMLGRVYAAERQFDRAIQQLQEANRLSGDAPYIQAELARTYAAAGRRDDARNLIGSLLRSSPADGARLGAQYPAYVYAALGDHDRAFQWLDRALDDREPNVLWAAVDPRLDDLRRDPRFEAVIRRIARGR